MNGGQRDQVPDDIVSKTFQEALHWQLPAEVSLQKMQQGKMAQQILIGKQELHNHSSHSESTSPSPYGGAQQLRVGGTCLAVYVEDGELYPARVLAFKRGRMPDDSRATVVFEGFEQEGPYDIDLDDIYPDPRLGREAPYSAPAKAGQAPPPRSSEQEADDALALFDLSLRDISYATDPGSIIPSLNAVSRSLLRQHPQQRPVMTLEETDLVEGKDENGNGETDRIDAAVRDYGGAGGLGNSEGFNMHQQSYSPTPGAVMNTSSPVIEEEDENGKNDQEETQLVPNLDEGSQCWVFHSEENRWIPAVINDAQYDESTGEVEVGVVSMEPDGAYFVVPRSHIYTGEQQQLGEGTTTELPADRQKTIKKTTERMATKNARVAKGSSHGGPAPSTASAPLSVQASDSQKGENTRSPVPTREATAPVAADAAAAKAQEAVIAAAAAAAYATVKEMFTKEQRAFPSRSSDAVDQAVQRVINDVGGSSGPGHAPTNEDLDALRSAALLGTDEDLSQLLMAWYAAGFQTGKLMSRKEQVQSSNSPSSDRKAADKGKSPVTLAKPCRERSPQPRRQPQTTVPSRSPPKPPKSVDRICSIAVVGNSAKSTDTAAITVDVSGSGGNPRRRLPQTITAKLVQGHRVASGLNKDPKFPGGTLGMQIPVFRRLGVDLGRYHPATLNLSIAPHCYRLLEPWRTLRQVDWSNPQSPNLPPEDFSVIPCVIRPLGSRDKYSAMIYYPHPETKPDYHATNVSDAMLEVLAPEIPGVTYGDLFQLVAGADEIAFFER
eukprot:Clim_evm16s13 gene=Clim_evmTU16s13